MTEAELEQWALAANWSGKRIDWLRLFLARFAIVPSSRALVLRWAEATQVYLGSIREVDLWQCLRW
jgi:hypothetical protein